MYEYEKPNCNNQGVICSEGTKCNKDTGICEPKCKHVKCPSGQTCNENTGKCEPELNCKLTGCPVDEGSVCNKTTGKCEPNCKNTGVSCPNGTKCNKTTGICEENNDNIDCRDTGCLFGEDCNKTTGKCEPSGVPDLNLCDNQRNFNHAFYEALKYTRKRDEQKISPFLTMYLIVHVIFLIWGIVLAFKSQPPENRLVHITLAIVFAPAYVLAYYLNAF